MSHLICDKAQWKLALACCGDENYGQTFSLIGIPMQYFSIGENRMVKWPLFYFICKQHAGMKSKKKGFFFPSNSVKMEMCGSKIN